MYLHSKKTKHPTSLGNVRCQSVSGMCRFDLNCFQLTVKARACGWGSKEDTSALYDIQRLHISPSVIHILTDVIERNFLVLTQKFPFSNDVLRKICH